MPDTELMPCPWCNGTATLSDTLRAGLKLCDGVWSVSCECGRSDGRVYTTSEAACDSWNTRARVAPKVKPIAWGKTSYGTPEAKTVFGFYRVNRAANGGHSVCIGRRVLSREDGLTNFPTEQEAKDAAQSDFDGLALSALEI